MSRINFGAPGAESATQPVDAITATEPASKPIDAAPVTGAVTTVPAPQPPAKPSIGNFSDNPDDIDFSQIKLPKLKIVQNVGVLAASFTPGAVVIVAPGDIIVPLNDGPPKTAKAAPQVPANLVILAMRKTDRWVEKTAYSDGPDNQQGRIFNTEQEAIQAGGTTSYDINKTDPSKPLFRPMATILALVQQPEKQADDPKGPPFVDEFGLFSIDAGGKRWCLVTYDMLGTAHTNGAKALRTARLMGAARKGWSTVYFGLSTTLKTFGSNSAFAPQFRPGAVLDEVTRADVAAVLAGAA